MIERIARISGVGSAAVAAILSVVVLVDIGRSQGVALRPVVMFGLVALCCAGGAAMAAIRRPALMLPFFVVAFVPMGMYLLGVPGYAKWIGVAQLCFLVSAVLMMVARRRRA